MNWGQSLSQRASHSLRLVFWRVTAWLIDGIVRNKGTIKNLIPYAPLIGYGAVAYTAGWIIGKLIFTYLV